MQKSEESDKKGISQEQLDAISAQIRELAAKTFHNMDLSSELISSAQMLLLGTSTTQDPAKITKDYITNNLFPKAVDSVFAAYQQDCFRFCLSRSQDPDISEDIAQEAIKLLLLSKNKVEKIGSWLTSTTYKLLLKHFDKSKKDKKLRQKLSLEATSYENWLTSGDLTLLKDLSPSLVDLLLQSDEYKQYQVMTSYNTMKEYAAAHDTNEETAQKNKEKIIRNLKSRALLSMGWRANPQILDHNQYNAIQKFIREVKRMCAGDESIKWIKSLSPEHAQAIKNIKMVADWGIAMTGERKFMLHLFTIFHDGQFFTITFNIVLSQRNSISIQSYKVNKHVASHNIPANIQIQKAKGKSVWTYEQIVSLLEGY